MCITLFKCFLLEEASCSQALICSTGLLRIYSRPPLPLQFRIWINAYRHINIMSNSLLSRQTHFREAERQEIVRTSCEASVRLPIKRPMDGPSSGRELVADLVLVVVEI